MRRILSTLACALAFACLAGATDIQGVLADWNCVKGMVRDGREKTLRQDKGCSLVKKYKRSAYGVITDDKKFFRLDESGNRRAVELLGNSSDKDNIKVLVKGDLDGSTIKVSDMTIL